MAMHVDRRLFSEPEQLCGGAGVAAYRFTPLEGGRFAAATTTIRFGDVALQLGHATPCLGFAVPQTAVVNLPLENAEGLVLNGVLWEPRLVWLGGAGAELLRTNPRPSGSAALGLPADAVEALLDTSSAPRLLRPGSQALLRAPPSAWDQALRLVRAAEAVAATEPGIFDEDQPRRALRDALLGAARALVARADGEQGSVRGPRAAAARRRIVVRTDEYLRAHLDRPIYVEELCAALGVSASALAEAFRAVFVVSSHRFLQLRRLGMVRTALRSREGPAPPVKSVALAHGFWHLGQFAHNYRAAFGEAPSETLARSGRVRLPRCWRREGLLF